MEVRRLDTVLVDLGKSEDQATRFHFLKSDTQSGEYQVLEGAEGFLQEDCLGLELELFRYPLYEGVVHEDKVKAFLEARGFHIAGWTGYKNSFDAQADYLFLKSHPANDADRQIVKEIERIYAPEGPNRYIKRISLLERVALRSKRTISNLKPFEKSKRRR